MKTHLHTTLLLAALATVSCGRAQLDEFPTSEGGNAQGGAGGGPVVGGGGQPPGGGGFGGAGGDGGFGGSAPCTVAQECEDGNPCTSNRCEGGQCVFPARDDDQDGAAPTQCGGTDCNDQNPDVFLGHPEDCTDGADNDCNGVADCFDPACQGGQECGCTPVSENCTNGHDDDCDTIVDCFDADCQGTPACGCLPNESGDLCVNGFDDDCDDAIDCDDTDCSGTEACQCQFAQEDCFDGLDDDCDLLIDCGDPDCEGIFPCACVPPGSPENCSDGFDNDCDGLPDCADSDCFASPACQMCAAEICDDGIDNDCDLKIDCADEACHLSPACPTQPEICNNSVDDDGDLLADCSDPDCATNPLCQQEHANCLSPQLVTNGSFFGDTTGHANETEGTCGGQAGEAVFFFVLSEPSFVHVDSSGSQFDSTLYVRTGVCNTGQQIGCDDDSGGNFAASLTFNILYPGTYYLFLDGYTVDPDQGPNEGPYQLNVQIIENPPEICDDGIDNDGDIYVDCADPDCTDVGACFHCNGGLPPEPEFGAGRCTDGQDNDCDGTIDCGDHDCHASPFYVTECCNGNDENGNGLIDDFNCTCSNDSECPADQKCYTHTVHACGIDCNFFFGDVCPNVQAGSVCNVATGQCEFP